MRGLKIPSKLQRAAKPNYGLPSVEAGKIYIPNAEQFREKHEALYLEGKAWFDGEELVTICNELFPEWAIKPWGNSASQYAERIDAGASNPKMRDKGYRLLRDQESGQYVMCSLEDGINFHDFGEAVHKAGIAALEHERENLKKAHYALPPELQRQAERQFAKTANDLNVLRDYRQHDQLTLGEAAKPQLSNGSGDDVKLLNSSEET